MQRKLIWEVFLLKRLHFRLNPISYLSYGSSPRLDGEDEFYDDVPKPRRRKSERKPFPTPMKVLIRRAKEERELRKDQLCKIVEEAPENGLLVPELVEVAHRVFKARESLFNGLSKLVNVVVPIKRCRY
ncbi:APO domain [Macleaya cordata]|uniref:APO domain n=1 Tax=Macleaya cordata TaxID=56857 RepID=A0A200RCC9_MACCD|nr:APO domain [Macleaya cordata]